MPREVFEFEDVTVDFRRVVVLRAGLPVALEPKTFEVLRYLLEHRDRLVTKEELLDAVWKDTFVTPNVLTRVVAQLRKGLGDDAFEARYIETVSKRGYRFIATVAVSTAEPAVTGHTERSWSWAPLAGVIVTAALGLGAFALWTRPKDGPPESVSPSALSPRRLTVDRRSYSFPSISPDGRIVAYSSDQSGTMEVYTVGLAAGSKELAITSDSGQNIQPEWSPDSQWLAYHSRTRGGIWIVPSSGGASRQLVDFGAQPFWAPDGERIIFTSDAGSMAAQSILWTVQRDGTRRQALTKLGSPRGGHSQPTVSPDGRLVAFTVSHGSLGGEIWTLPLAGGDGIKLGTGTAQAAPHFSRDGRSVYWTGRTTEGNDALMRIGVDGNGAPVGTPEVVLPFTGSFLGGLSIARDGTAVIALHQATANLWAVDVPGNGTPLPPVPLTHDEVRNTAPRYSQSGRLAFHQQAAGQRNTTWLIDDDGKNREPLTVGLSVSVWGPQWAPDGKRVFVVVTDAARKFSYAWLDTTTRQLTPISVDVKDQLSPSLSPDGREVAFHVIDESGVLNVWTQQLDGGARKRVTFDKEAMSYPQWSPDGKWLVVEIKRGDVTHIGVVSRDGGLVEDIVTERGQNWPSSWAADNDRIAFAGARDGVWNIFSVSRKTKQIRQLTYFNSVEGYVRYPTWSPRGDRVVFERAEQRGSLWTVTLP